MEEEFNQFAVEQLDAAGALVFGRETYDLMAGNWLTPQAIQDDPVIVGWMNRLPKFVFSTSHPKADWHNTTLLNGNAALELAKRLV